MNILRSPRLTSAKRTKHSTNDVIASTIDTFDKMLFSVSLGCCCCSFVRSLCPLHNPFHANRINIGNSKVSLSCARWHSPHFTLNYTFVQVQHAIQFVIKKKKKTEKNLLFSSIFRMQSFSCCVFVSFPLGMFVWLFCLIALHLPHSNKTLNLFFFLYSSLPTRCSIIQVLVRLLLISQFLLPLYVINTQHLTFLFVIHVLLSIKLLLNTRRTIFCKFIGKME